MRSSRFVQQKDHRKCSWFKQKLSNRKKSFFLCSIRFKANKYFSYRRGGEFKNGVIEEILEAFGIRRSLSPPGSPTDNAVAEATYNIIKTEFAFEKHFVSMDELEIEWFSYVNWYNNRRIHGTLGYLSPNDYASLPSPS
jgi:transposase InsO family protein